MARLYFSIYFWDITLGQKAFSNKFIDHEMLTAAKIHGALNEQGITHVVGLPDNLSRVFFQGLIGDPSIEVIQVSREGEAFAIAAGLHIGGEKAVVLMQNTGLLESGDALRGTSWNMRIPQVILLCYRGFKSLKPEVERKDSVAVFTEPTLKAWDIPFEIMRDDKDLAMIHRAFERAQSSSKPAAVIMAETTV